jgi:hypothetical protein
MKMGQLVAFVRFALTNVLGCVKDFEETPESAIHEFVLEDRLPPSLVATSFDISTVDESSTTAVRVPRDSEIIVRAPPDHSIAVFGRNFWLFVG